MKKLMKTSLDNISIDTLKDGEKKSMNRILRTGAKAGLREDNDRRATLKAIRDSIGPMLDKLVLWFWQASEGLEATARHAIYGVQWRRLDRELLGLLQDRSRV